MEYNFSEFMDNKDEVLNDFLYKHTSCLYVGIENEESTTLYTYYKNIIDLFSKTFTMKTLLKLVDDLTIYKITSDIPYIITLNEIYGLKNILISKISDKKSNLYIVEIMEIFKEINNNVASIYLKEYIEKLLCINNIRHNSLSDLVEKNFISHYESHLVWLTNLAKHIRDEDIDNFVELDDTICEFGKWLHTDAKKIIQNNSKYKIIDILHKNLHMFGKKLYAQIGKNEYHILITYLEKCELISLSIGTELALIDNILMNNRITKDSLTGSLNRQALRNVFESQYELSLATTNPFILAMCDLDFFKNVNDNYGHIAGDKMLILFVEIVKENIRNTDIIIRYGGEEFIIILPAVKRDKAVDILEKVRKDFAKVILDFNGDKISTTVSIGLVEIRPEKYFKQNFIDEYIMIADQKLYTAKDNGRNRIEF